MFFIHIYVNMLTQLPRSKFRNLITYLLKVEILSQKRRGCKEMTGDYYIGRSINRFSSPLLKPFDVSLKASSQFPLTTSSSQFPLTTSLFHYWDIANKIFILHHLIAASQQSIIFDVLKSRDNNNPLGRSKIFN